MNAAVAPVYVRASELARILSISTRTLYEWKSTVEGFPHLDTGGAILFPLDETLAFIRAHPERLRHAARVRSSRPSKSGRRKPKEEG